MVEISSYSTVLSALDIVSLLRKKLLPERKKVEETDEMDQVELVDFDPNQAGWHHYNGEAHENDEHHPGAMSNVRPLNGASE